MDKVALCLYGRFNNRHSKSAGVNGFEYIKKQILEDRKVDIFVYSHDLANEEIIRNLYGSYSVNMVFEPLPDFQSIIGESDIDATIFTPIEDFSDVANTLSFLYSRKRSLELLQQNMGNKYSAAVCCRFDLGQLDRRHRRVPAFAVSEINFHPERDMSHLYSAMWNQLNMGFADQWFYSNPEQLIQLGDMYDRVFEYLSPNSEYLRWLYGGITDSKMGDMFSNEILLDPSDKAVRRDSIPIKHAIHNHLIHKFFLIENGLYKKAAFTSDFADTAHVLYTHSSYSDLWPAYFGQESRYLNAFSKNYVLLDKFSESIPKHYTQITYDEKAPYVNRLLQCLSMIPEATIFFDHEDMILLDYPNLPEIRKAWARLVRRKNSFARPLDFVRLIRSGLDSTVRDPRNANLRHLLPWSSWHFSIQPSIWSKRKLMALLSRHTGQGIWDFENSAQKSVRRMRLRGAILSSEGAKKGIYAYHNPIYPYTATAISKGKWTTSEYSVELRAIFEAYGINPNLRGEI